MAAELVTAALVALGGAIGAPARFWIDGEIKRLAGDRWPLGTMFVNIVGALVLGLVAHAVYAGALAGWFLPLLGTGFCGALTTFSTFSYDTYALISRRAWGTAVTSVVVTLALGVGAFALGWALVG
ncbi:MAG: fluoride efflux transporter CrcB [Propionibacteriaceae bacterium]|nr:fluoride efflux transporter CrcB [Propionibacteriaceae bacterium]